jgi:hypothetical protein
MSRLKLDHDPTSMIIYITVDRSIIELHDMIHNFPSSILDVNILVSKSEIT